MVRTLRFNVSQVRTWLECPTKAHYAHTLLRVPNTRAAVALEVGTCWHLAMEQFLKTRDKAWASQAVSDYLESSPDPKVASGWEAIHPAFMAWEWPDDWELLGVEQLVEHKFSAPFELIIQGRLDGLVKWAGQYWHLQHKTLSPSTPLSVYYAYMQRDWHECWYEHACREAGYVPYGGTILNVCRKLSAKAIQADPQSAISVQYIPRAQHLVRKAMFDLEHLGFELLRDQDFPESITQNRSSCAGRFGNSLCPYLEVCNQVADITDDTLFKTIEDRYTTQEAPLTHNA